MFSTLGYIAAHLLHPSLSEQNLVAKQPNTTTLVAFQHKSSDATHNGILSQALIKNSLNAGLATARQNLGQNQRFSVSGQKLAQTTVTGTTYYISATGNDRNSGTSTNSAWRTIGKINNVIFKPGDRILFQGGTTFSGNLSFNANDKGSASNPIIISSYGTGRATINAGTGKGIMVYNTAGYNISNLNVAGSGAGTNTGDGIAFYNDLAGNIKLDGITIDSVEVQGFRNYGIGIGGWNQQSGYRNVRVTNVATHRNGKGGLVTYAQLPNVNENVYVAYVRAFSNPGIPGDPTPTGSGIVLGGVNTGVIERSVAYDNGALNNAANGPVGIWAYDSTKIIIQYNESYRNRTGGTADGDGFDLDQNVSNSIMQYNYSHNNDGAGFLLCQGPNNSNHTGNIIRYNISQNDGRKLNYGGIHIYGYVRNAEIYNNTVFVQGGTTSIPSAIYIHNPVTNVRFRNNILQTKDGVKLLDVASGSTGLAFQGNVYYSTGSTFRIRWGSTTYSSLDSWRTGTNQERLGTQNVGVSLDPMLINPGGGQILNNADLLNTLDAYKLRADSPLIDNGLDLKTLFGIDPGNRDFYGSGLPKSLGFDIGTHEF
ncbi:parallel beta-helix repeat-containing protein [Nostoc sp. NIES-3756]|uniref:right-handed parallel beta-helix repeat-containing protein n=1 Tax=Nostoc sp. NIES-3756 TaxID=1751286 RepID=UPI0007227ED6|nr:right-handed parallel beta-helix repeat-containing protein [Nostoc sp. NIES-3756]BAT55526.1 parallel beta-helix repeat-containing protein [Nostoc sp. NIES-3756]